MAIIANAASYLLSTSPILALFIFSLAFIIYNHNIHTEPPKTDFTTAPECRCIIDGSRFPDPERKPNRLTQSEARAIPNRPVQRIFGVDNAFTTENERVAGVSVHKAEMAMKEARVDWEGLSAVLYLTTWAYLKGCKKTLVPLPLLVQVLVLRMSLWVFFKIRGDIDHDEFIDLAVSLDTYRPNLEDGDEDEIPDFEDNDELQDQLRVLFPEYSIATDARPNPLNFMLHPFETLSPLILRLFLELRRHDTHKPTLSAFIKKPTSTQFNLELGDDQISAEHLVKEALRLYPPIRQIHRAFQADLDPEKQAVLTAQIESCQLDAKTWGLDALEFKPERWKKVSVVQNLSFLAFGSRPFLCPASHDFGPRVVGLIVGIMLDVIRDEWPLKETIYEEADEEMGYEEDQYDLDLVCKGRLRNDNDRDADVGVYLDCSGSENAWEDV